MKEEFLIPGMYLSREDMQRVYIKQMKLSESEAKERADKLSDNHMVSIADAFASEFFDVREDLFQEILIDAMDSLCMFER